MRVTLVISNLQLGGAERMLAFIANYLAENGWKVTVVTFTEKKDQFKLCANVRRLSALVPSSGVGMISRLREAVLRHTKLRSVILNSKPEVVITFLDECNVRVLMALFGSGVPVIAAERNDPHYQKLPFPWSTLRRLFYPAAAALAIQTQSASLYFSARVRARTRIIPNPVPPSKVMLPFGTMNSGAREQKRIVGLGRLAWQKGFDLLIEAFSQIAAAHPEWTLIIYGEGERRNALESLVRTKSLESRVILPGAVQQVPTVLSEASVFVLSSRYEGFPNALCEAMACGLPVISFDCPSGPNEIIRHNIDGILVKAGDIEALAKALDTLIRDNNLRRSLAVRATEITKRFEVKKIMNMWEELLRSVV